MDSWILLPVAALVLGLLALAPLGAQVLARGVVFIDLAVAQAAAAAALWAGAHWHAAGPWAAQGAAMAGALGCAGLVSWLARRWQAQREALIGLVYVAGACLAILGVRLDPHGSEKMASLLAADILWAGPRQVLTLAACALIVWLLAGPGRQLLARDRWFYPVFAVVASLAVPVLGLLLVFACLIAPALWLRAGRRLPGATAIALVTAGIGLAASWFFDAPSGACVSLAIAAGGVLSVAVAGSRTEAQASPGPDAQASRPS